MSKRKESHTLGSVAFSAWLARTSTRQSVVVAALKVSASTVHRWKNGQGKPSDAKRIELQQMTRNEVPASLWALPVPVSP